MRVLSNFWNFFRIIRLFILQIVALSTRQLFLKLSLLTAPTLASEQMLLLLALPDPRFSARGKICDEPGRGLPGLLEPYPLQTSCQIGSPKASYFRACAEKVRAKEL